MHVLQQIIKNRCFALQQEAKDWKEAVRLACNLLEQRGCITKEYYKGILKSTKKNGPYYAIADGFAMPHTRPENGVIKTGFSLVTFKKGVNFNSDYDPIRVVLVFAAKDKKEMNESVIVNIMEFLEEEELFKKVRDATTEEEFISCFK